MYAGFLDFAKYYEVTIQHDAKEGMIIQFPNDLHGLEKYLYVQFNDEPIVHLKLNAQNQLVIPDDGKEKQCKIVIQGNKKDLSKTLISLKIPSPESIDSNPPAISPLTTFDIKSLVYTENLPALYNPGASASFTLQTDLHSHLTSVPTSSDLVDMVTFSGKRPFYYPAGFLLKMGITDLNPYRNVTNAQGIKVILSAPEAQQLKSAGFVTSDLPDPHWGLVHPEIEDKELVDINSLNSVDRKILEDHLSIMPTQQVTFNELDAIYDFRWPIMSISEFFEPLLRLTAKKYQAAGVKHASISFSRIIKPEFIAIIDRVLPELEKEFGVRLTFLVAMLRTLDKAKQDDIVAQIKAVITCPYIEGLDVIGSEINSTYDFYITIRKFAAWCLENGYSHKVIRIHAGETPYHPENVSVAVRLAYETGMRVRIGHGVYGTLDDDELINFIHENQLEERLIFEMCPDSNYALNHVDNTQNHVIIKLAESGIPICLCTDGPGLYYTDSIQLAHHAERFKVGDGGLSQIIKSVANTESFYIESTNILFQQDKAKFEEEIRSEFFKNLQEERDRNQAELSAAQISAIREKTICEYYKKRHVQYTEKNWTQEKQQEADRIKAEKLENVHKVLRQRSTQLIVPDQGGRIPFPNGKIPIMITGGLIPGHTTPQEMEAHLNQIRAMLGVLIESCDPEKVCFVTTGNDVGIQRLIHEVVKNKFDVVGLLSKTAKPEDISPNLTHAVVGYDKWYDMHGLIGRQIELNKDFQIVAIGGNMITRNIIQTAVNVITQGDLTTENHQVYLLRGVPGAAEDKAKHLPSQFSVHNIPLLLSQILPSLQSKGALKSSLGTSHLQYDSLQGNWEMLTRVPEIKQQYIQLLAYVLKDAVDNMDRAHYFIQICELCNIQIDNKPITDSEIIYQVKDFFGSGSLRSHPFATKFVCAENIKAIQSQMLPHFASLGLNDLKEMVQNYELNVQAPPPIVHLQNLHPTQATGTTKQEEADLPNLDVAEKMRK